MNAFLKKAGLGIALAATALTAAAPADAQRWGGYRGGWHDGYHRGGIGAGGAAVLGGLLGLGVGAAIASDHNRGYYNGGYYGNGYYDGPPPPPRAYYNGYEGYNGYYAPHCWRQWRWDPYYGRNVPVRVCN